MEKCLLYENRVRFFSRDDRTHRLFRSCWVAAAEEVSGDPTIVCRNFGVLRFFWAISQFISNCRRIRLVFGTSEIILYSILSGCDDVWIFTGLGRLFTRKNWIASIVKCYLKIVYRNQTVVVLNKCDQLVVGKILNAQVSVINGEGYHFTSMFEKRALKNDQRISFIYVGRLLKSKGVDRLLEAFARASQKDWELVLYGDSDFNNSDCISLSFIKRQQQLSPGRIIHAGFLDDLKTRLVNADVAVSLSEREGLPFSVLDAIDCGLYVVLSNVPGHNEFSAYNGVSMIDANGVEGFFKMLESRPELVKIFDMETRHKQCYERFSWQKVNGEIKKILECK